MADTRLDKPDVVSQDKKSGEYVFFDCAAETEIASCCE